MPREIASGITLAALITPLNIGFAQVAGLPPIAGLYAAVIPLAVFALLTSSRDVVGSPCASVAALMGAALLGFAVPGDPLRMQFALALALTTGIVFLIFWRFRLAFLANFLSRAVMVGFISGLAIEVFTNQLRKILAVTLVSESHGGVVAAAAQLKEAMATSVETEGYFLEVLALVESIPGANWYSVAIGLGALVIVRLLKRYAPKVPGALVALTLLTVIVAVFNLDEKGVGVFGALPSAAPTLTRPGVPLVEYVRLLPGALALVGITLCEAMLLVRRYSRKRGYEVDGDQELFAYGVANVAASFTGSLVFGVSPSRTAAMDSSGARSQLPSLVAAGTITLVMLFFSNILAYLPSAALAGIVANAVLSLIEVSELRELFRIRRSEFWIAVVCLVSVLALGPLRAVTVAFLLAIIDVIRRSSRPGTWVLREAPDGSHFVPLTTDSTPDQSGLIVYRFGSPLYFANANLFLEEVEKLVTQGPTPIRCFVLDAEAMVDIDTTGAEAFHEVLTLLGDCSVTFAIARANATLPPLLKRYGLLELIGENRFYPTNRHAAAALSQEDGQNMRRAASDRKVSNE